MTKKNKDNISDEELFNFAMNKAKVISKKKLYKKNLNHENNLSPTLNKQNVNTLKNKNNLSSIKVNKEKNSSDELSIVNYSEIDKSLVKKLKKGHLSIDRTLDLHGLTQNESYKKLKIFIDSNYKSGNRNLLVITGKGNKVDQELNKKKNSSKGILRTSLPLWLEEYSFKIKIISHKEAFSRHGGQGARYIILRKFKTDKKIIK